MYLFFSSSNLTFYVFLHEICIPKSTHLVWDWHAKIFVNMALISLIYSYLNINLFTQLCHWHQGEKIIYPSLINFWKFFCSSSVAIFQHMLLLTLAVPFKATRDHAKKLLWLRVVIKSPWCRDCDVSVIWYCFYM